MSTRCTITVYAAGASDDSFSIYRHGDGYPEGENGVLEGLRAALASPLSWEFPRFEADEYAATIVATWKTRAGGIRLSKAGRDGYGDTAYHYDVSLAPARHALFVKVWQPADGDDWVPVSAALIFPDRVRPVKLSKADQAKAATLAPEDPAVALAALRQDYEATQREVAELRAQVRALVEQPKAAGRRRA